MRRAFIAGNWKMYKTIPESVELVEKLKAASAGIDDRDILVCPPATSLQAVHNVIKDSNIQLGGQNMYWEKQGAFTGMVSPGMLLSAGCKWVILGHSERRNVFHEVDEEINKKVLSALDHDLNPILCVGEKIEEREAGKAEDVVKTQLDGGLKDISNEQMAKITIAYEPVWAIGTGKTATPEDADDMHKFIRNYVKDNYGEELADSVRILYGGSVKPENIDSLMAKENIDGALVGGASLKDESFSRIIKFED